MALKAYPALIALMVIVDIQNVAQAMRDQAAMGHPIPVIEPIIWEGSSGVGLLLFAPLVYLAAVLAPPRREMWARFLLVHPPASVLFSALHILVMYGVRVAVYAMLGARYHGPVFDFANEYRKDILAYVIIAGLIWLARGLDARRGDPAPAAGATFDIRDGSRVIRTPIADIVAVSSAGNYVEVVLADGRRPLMRSTLAAAEARLQPHGFVRTHCSWLVNAGRVRELTAVGSGDFSLRLEGGTEAPLSRRFREAQQLLQGARGA